MINILFCLNDKYVPKLVCALCSLFETNQESLSRLNIMIRTNDMSNDTISHIMTLCQRYGLTSKQLQFFFTTELCDRLEMEHVEKFKGSYLCYFKLFELDKLNHDISRLLVMDCDILIKSSIVQLYNQDLQGKPFAAVREFPTNHTKHGENQYGEYNTGILLVDLAKYKEYEIEQRLKHYIKKIPPTEWKTGDQTLFTLCLEKDNLVLTLPLKYNFIINQLFFSYKEFSYIRDISDNYYSEDEYEEARKNPCIEHLISGDFVSSPWFFEGERKIKKEWDQYIENFGWFDSDDVYSHLSVAHRLRRLVLMSCYRGLPRNVSCWIFRWLYRKFG